MSEENAVVKLGELGLSTEVDRTAFDAMVESKFLPRLQLMTSSSKQVKSGEFPMNHYALVRGQDFRDLGETVDVLIVSWRSKAIDMSGDEIISVFDQTNPEFARIKAKSEVKDSQCMYGPDYLILLPEDKTFCTFLMGSASARNEAGLMQDHLGGMATLGSQPLSNKRYSWQAPKVMECTAEPLFDPETVERLRAVKEDFDNPPEVEMISEEEEAAAANRER